MLKRFLVFASFVGMIAAVFQPYVSMITGYDLLLGDAGSVLSSQAKLILALSPLLGLYGLFAFFKKWHSALYILPTLLVIGAGFAQHSLVCLCTQTDT